MRVPTRRPTVPPIVRSTLLVILVLAAGGASNADGLGLADAMDATLRPARGTPARARGTAQPEPRAPERPALLADALAAQASEVARAAADALGPDPRPVQRGARDRARSLRALAEFEQRARRFAQRVAATASAQPASRLWVADLRADLRALVSAYRQAAYSRPDLRGETAADQRFDQLTERVYALRWLFLEIDQATTDHEPEDGPASTSKSRS